jgi:Tfp pilus assembly protein PilV
MSYILSHPRIAQTSRVQPAISVRGPHKVAGGFSLLEVSIAVVLAGMVTAAGLWFEAQKMRTQLADSQAEVLVTLNNAVNAFEANSYSSLANGTSIPGVANPYAPSIAELTSLGLLTNGFSTRNLYGGGYQISLAKTPTGCVGTACNISGYTAMTSPITGGNGREDDAAAGEALLQAGGDAGISTMGFPGTINGTGGAWSMPNPMGNVGGILALRNGYAASGFSQFLRRDGSLPMTGNLNMNGQSVTNASVVGTNTLNAATVNASGISSGNIANSGTVTSGNVAAGNTVSAPNGNITTLSTSTIGASQIWTTNLNASETTSTNFLSAQNAGIAGNTWSGSATTGGRQTVGEYVQINGTANVGGGCGPNGLVAQNGAGQLLSCVNGVWRTPFSGTSVRYVWSSYGNVINAQTGAPDAGHADCAPNEIVVGGGASCQDGLQAHVHFSGPDGNGWTANCYRDDATGDNPAAAAAVCLNVN